MSQSQAQASCGPAHPAGPAASRHEKNDAGTKQRPAGVHHVLRQSSPPDALRTLSRQRHADRIRRYRGSMQNSDQTTVVLFGNALDPRGRTNHPQPASPRPHRKPVAPVLAKNQPVWCSRPTLVTGHTPQEAIRPRRAATKTQSADQSNGSCSSEGGPRHARINSAILTHIVIVPPIKSDRLLGASVLTIEEALQWIKQT